MKITIEFDSPADRAIAIAQAVINASIERSKGFQPGGIINKGGDEEVTIKQGYNTPVTRMAEAIMKTPMPPLTCPDCGGLYGAHKEECSKFNFVPKLKEANKRLQRELEIEREVNEKLRKEYDELSKNFGESGINFARRFAAWFDSEKEGNWDEPAVVNFERFLKTLPQTT